MKTRSKLAALDYTAQRESDSRMMAGITRWLDEGQITQAQFLELMRKLFCEGR